MPDKFEIAQLTAEIVAAHVSNNHVAVSDMPLLIQKVYEALSSLSPSVEEAGQAKTSAVSVRASVKPDYIVCMECGRKQKTLKRHLRVAHGTTPEEYRKDYGLPRDYPMAAPEYSQRRREMAQKIGLGHNKRKSKTES